MTSFSLTCLNVSSKDEVPLGESYALLSEFLLRFD